MKNLYELWEQPKKVSQQALSQRLTSLPYDLFLKVLQGVLPKAQERWFTHERPLSPELQWADEHYRHITRHISPGDTTPAPAA